MREQPNITEFSQTKHPKFVIISDGTRSGTILMVDGVKIEDVCKVSLTINFNQIFRNILMYSYQKQKTDPIIMSEILINKR